MWKKYLLWLIIPAAFVCVVFSCFGTFRVFDIVLVGGFSLLVNAIVLTGRLIAWSATRVEIKDSVVIYSTKTAGYESVEYKKSELIFTAKNLSAVVITNKGIELFGEITLDECRQSDTTIKRTQATIATVLIPPFFHGQDELKKRLLFITGGKNG